MTSSSPDNSASAAPPPGQTGAGKWRARWGWFTRTYLTADPRSLAVGRIALATVLLTDLLRRVPDLELWYSNLGLVPNHTLLWRPPTQWMFSLFFCASWTDEAAIGFVLCGLAYLGLLVGWRTRLMQVLSLIAVLSLHGRSTFIENGGDWMLAELSLWSAFLPLGRAFSIDAWLAGLRAGRAGTNAPDTVTAGGPRFAPVVSLAVFAILLQLAVSYLFNALHKGGPTWRDGSAVHYVLHQDRMVTPIAVWARPYMTLPLSRVLSWASLVMEAALPLLIFSPVRRVLTRRLAIVAVVSLHAGFQLAINLGIFSLVMIAYAPYLMGKEDWDALARRSAGRGPGPLQRAWSWLLRRPIMVAIAARVAAQPAPPPPVPAVVQWRRFVGRVREAAVVLMIATLISELFIGNAALSTRVKLHQPLLLKMLVAYPRLIQAWSMFAPDAPMGDETIVVDAVTADGRHVDPYNQIAGRYPTHATTEIPARLDNDSFFFNYSSRIPFTQTYWGALQEWILAHHRRTGRAEDRIVSFEVWVVEDDSPPPGQTQPRNVRSRVFLRFPAK